jgi:hypothetical protein
MKPTATATATTTTTTPARFRQVSAAKYPDVIHDTLPPLFKTIAVRYGGRMTDLKLVERG